MKRQLVSMRGQATHGSLRYPTIAFFLGHFTQAELGPGYVLVFHAFLLRLPAVEVHLSALDFRSLEPRGHFL